MSHIGDELGRRGVFWSSMRVVLVLEDICCNTNSNKI